MRGNHARTIESLQRADDRQVALAAAALYGQAQTLATLIDLGVDLNVYSPAGFNEHGTALHHAVDSGSLDAVKVLKPFSRAVISSARARDRFGLATLLLATTLSACRARPPEPAPAPGPTLKAHLHRTLAAHSEPAREVAFSPDSRVLATSGVDRAVKLWSLPDATLRRTLAHPEGVTSVAYSPDGQWLVSGSYDGSVRIWRVADGALARTLTGHGGTLWSVAVSPDGQTVASSGEDKTVKLWRLADGALLRTLRGHELNVWSVDFSADGQRVVSGSFDRTVKVWRTVTGSLERTLTGHEQAVVGVDFSPVGDLVASGSDDSSVRLWRAGDGALVGKLTGGSGHVYTVAFSPDGQWLASGGREKGALGTLWNGILGNRRRSVRSPTVRLWRVRDGGLQQALAGHSGNVWSVAFSSDGNWLASSSEDTTVSLWRLERKGS